MLINAVVETSKEKENWELEMKSKADPNPTWTSPFNDQFRSMFKEHIKEQLQTMSPEEVEMRFPWHQLEKEDPETQGAEPCPKVNAEWHKFRNQYYHLMSHQTCRLPDCLDTCGENQAHLVAPSSLEELVMLFELWKPDQVDILLGVYLPVELPVGILCEGKSCNQYLEFANGTQFQYHPWMGRRFDRVTQDQPRCFGIATYPGDQSYWKEPEVLAVPCGQQYRAICKSSCPKSGTPTSPAAEKFTR